MARVRNNQGHRAKILNVFMRPFLEQEHTQEKEAFDQARETIKPLQDKTWQLAKNIVGRFYTPKDVEMAYHLQNKFPNVNTIAKDSCFHFGYMNKKDGSESNDDGEWRNDNRHSDNEDEEDKYITKHFDFRLDGNINGSENSRQNDFAYAYFRDELKGKVNKGEKCNPDINIEQKWGNGSGEENQLNPHWTQCEQANERELGLTGGKENQTSYSREWNNDYQLDLIGREYCRDRSIACSEKEYQILMIWQQAKSQLIMAHEKWITSVLNQVGKIKTWLKSWKYLDEALDFTKKANCPIDEAEIIRCNSTGLAIFNPQNCADYLESMKNKDVSREDKIKARLLYNQQQSQQ